MSERRLLVLLAVLLLPATTSRAQGDAPSGTRTRPGARVESVEAGFDGVTREGDRAHVRIVVVNDGGPDSLEVRLRQGLSTGSLEWRLPIEAPAASRRTHVLAWAPSAVGVVSWSLDGAAWTSLDLPPPVGPAAPVVVVVGDAGADLPGQRRHLEALHSSDWRQVAVTPEDAPDVAAAWDVADVIVVATAGADRMRPAAWRALLDHVLTGAVLVVHGSEPASALPDEARAARQGIAVPLGMTDGPAVGLPLAPVTGAEPVALPGFEPASTWAARRAHGRGAVVMVGLDLHAVAPARGEAAWKALLDPSLAPSRRRIQDVRPAIVEAARNQAGLQQEALLVTAAALIVLLAAVLAASWLLSRRPLHDRRAVVLGPALGAAVAAPVLGVGACVRSVDEVMTLRVVEEFPSAGRRRTSDVWVATRSGTRLDVPLTSPVARVGRPHGLPDIGLRGRLHVGDRPRVEDLSLPGLAGGNAWIECERWEDAPARRRVERVAGGLRVLADPEMGEASAILRRDGVLAATGPIPAGGSAAAQGRPGRDALGDTARSLSGSLPGDLLLLATPPRRRGLLVGPPGSILVASLTDDPAVAPADGAP